MSLSTAITTWAFIMQPWNLRYTTNLSIGFQVANPKVKAMHAASFLAWCVVPVCHRYFLMPLDGHVTDNHFYLL